jgi:hypothetical protein
MIQDPIVEEIRRYRQEHSAKYDHDLKKICAALREREAQSDKKVVNRGPVYFSEKLAASKSLETDVFSAGCACSTSTAQLRR